MDPCGKRRPIAPPKIVRSRKRWAIQVLKIAEALDRVSLRRHTGVATYQLYRDPVAGGVEAIRFVWNGERLVEDEDP